MLCPPVYPTIVCTTVNTSILLTACLYPTEVTFVYLFQDWARLCVCACVRACVCTYCWHDYDCDTRVTIQLDWITNTLTLSALITNLLTHRTQESLSKTGGHWYAFDCIHTNIEFETGTHISISNEEVTCEVCHIHVMVCLFDTQHNKQFNNLIKQISANIIQVYVVKYLKMHHTLASHHSLCLLYYDTYI